MEGVFDETARFLLIIASLGSGPAPTYASIENDSWGTLKNKLQTFGNNFVSTIFDGHENHLRNSITHARFTFNATNNTIGFEDYSTRTNTSWEPQYWTTIVS